MSVEGDIPWSEVPARMLGIVDHLHRAKWLLVGAGKQPTEALNFRLLLAACNSARAIIELMLEDAESGAVTGQDDKSDADWRREYEGVLIPQIRRYFLIEAVRIHDFHRCGIRWEDIKNAVVWLSGPMRFRAKGGSAAVEFGPEGARSTVEGNASVRMPRPLQARNGTFLDAETGEWLGLREALSEYLVDVEVVVNEHARLVVKRARERAAQARTVQ